MSNLYEFNVKDAKGNDVSLKDYMGKVLIIVNTATGCGFTPQYKGLEYLYKQYQSKGLEILDFPCNQFAGQAPGSIEKIIDFCQLKYDVTFKTFAKVKVNGKDAIELYNYLTKQLAGPKGNRIRWNFTKFLVNREGEVVKRFEPGDTPESMENDILKLL